MKKFLVIVLAPLCLAAPQVGFGDASEEEIAEIRGGTYLEGFDENPQYNFNYKVADDKEQTYIAKDETRDGAEVTGTYSYVDPLGSLITVTYTAGVSGYQETREVQENFITIREKPVKVGANGATVSVNAAAAAEAKRLEAARIEASRLQATRAAAAESARIEAERLKAQRDAAAEASRVEAARIEAERLQAQRAAAAAEADAAAEAAAEAAAAVETAAAAEAARIEASRLQAQRAAAAEASRIETVRLQNERSAATEAARLEAIRALAAEASRLEAERAGSASSPITNLFGTGGNLSVRLSTPDIDISYGH